MRPQSNAFSPFLSSNVSLFYGFSEDLNHYSGIANPAVVIHRIGKLLIKKYQAYKNTEKEVPELILRTEDHWIKLETQIEFLGTIWNTLEDRLQVHQSTLLHMLYVKLQDATGLLDGAIGTPQEKPSMISVIGKNGPWRRLKYALSLKECLKRLLKDLQMWHEMFDPSWYLIIRVSGAIIDQHLDNYNKSTGKASPVDTFKAVRDAVNLGADTARDNQTVFLPQEYLGERREHLEYSSLQIVQKRHDSGAVLVDSVRVKDVESLNKKRQEVRNLARILSHTDPLTFGLLKCEGVVDFEETSTQNGRFKFIFEIPARLKSPCSVRRLLAASTSPPSLNLKLDIVRSLANSVMYIHTASYVHKNIRPETVVVFETDIAVRMSSFLVGFENFRPADGQTWLLGDISWEKDLYRHPNRQGIRPQEQYIMQHDIYSLGVCLLEIGLWMSFVVRKAGSDQSIPNPELHIEAPLSLRNQTKKAFQIKTQLVEMAKNDLPHKMGNKYTDVVLSCLRCLDENENGFGHSEEFQDADGILVGVRFIEDVSAFFPLEGIKWDSWGLADGIRFCCGFTRFPYKREQVETFVIFLHIHAAPMIIIHLSICISPTRISLLLINLVPCHVVTDKHRYCSTLYTRLYYFFAEQHSANQVKLTLYTFNILYPHQLEILLTSLPALATQ